MTERLVESNGGRMVLDPTSAELRRRLRRYSREGTCISVLMYPDPQMERFDVRAQDTYARTLADCCGEPIGYQRPHWCHGRRVMHVQCVLAAVFSFVGPFPAAGEGGAASPTPNGEVETRPCTIEASAA